MSIKNANDDDKKMMIYTGKSGAKDADYKNKAIVRINNQLH